MKGGEPAPEDLSLEQHRLRMRDRIAPALARLPQALQGLVRRCHEYRWPGWGQTEGAPVEYRVELVVASLELLTERARVADQQGVFDALDHADREVRNVARRLAADCKLRAAAGTLLRQFLTMPLERHEIGLALSYLDSKKARRQLIRWMMSHADPQVRWEAAYVLTWDEDRCLTEPFLDVLGNLSEEARTRQQAIEALGYLLLYANQRTLYYRRVCLALLSYLEHPDPAFRFWTCFALGQARCRGALSRLQGMARSDPGRVPNWWSVAEEASDAIRAIRTGRWPHREASVSQSSSGCSPDEHAEP